MIEPVDGAFIVHLIDEQGSVIARSNPVADAALARATRRLIPLQAKNARTVVLDEPSEGLAPVIVDELAELFVRLTREGVSILLIEQNFGLVHRATERYYVLAKGTVVDEGRMAGLTIDSLKKHVAV